MSNTAPDIELTRGIALVCGHDGVIRSVLHDDLCLNGANACGRQLSTIVDASNTDKATSFLAEAVARGAAFDWELSVNVDGATQVVHFAAATTPPDGVLVVGATSRSGVMHFYDELMRVNNEQANALRRAIKLYAIERPADRDAGVYEELTQLNNELATVQREVTKKNIALERANALKNQFLGMAAHDLRNPIGAIRSYAMLLLDDEMSLTPEQRRKFLDRIRESSEFMLALINDPEVVFLDELTTGLDPQARRKIWELVRGIRERGKTVFLTTHLMEEAERLCDRVAIIEHGRIIDIDQPQRLVDKYCPERSVIIATDDTRATDSLGQVPGAQSVVRQDSRITVRGVGNGFVTDVIRSLSENRITVTDFRTEMPNLEDVFIKLTGHSIRD